MLSPTPPGHWISIVLQIAERDALPVELIADALAQAGGGEADAFHRLLASQVQIQPSAPRHLHQAPHRPDLGAAADHPALPGIHLGPFAPSRVRRPTVLTAMFGEGFAFDDATHEDDGLPVRSFPVFLRRRRKRLRSHGFTAASTSAFGNENGLEQGRCVGAYAAALKTEA